MSGPRRIMAHMVALLPDRAASLRLRAGSWTADARTWRVQFPFSDPTADGPDIQAACTAALAGRVYHHRGFRLVVGDSP